MFFFKDFCELLITQGLKYFMFTFVSNFYYVYAQKKIHYSFSKI